MGLFIDEDYSMHITLPQLKQLIAEELTATDKKDIERMIRKQLKDDLKSAVEKAVKEEVQSVMSDKATQKEIADISKTIIKKLYKDLSFHHPYIIDRIKI